MSYSQIPTAQEFKRACGRTGLRAKFKTKNDLEGIFSALATAEASRMRTDAAAIPPLRAVRKACCAWLTTNKTVTRVSAPKVKDLLQIVHSTITANVERTYGGQKIGLPAHPTFKDAVQRTMQVRGKQVGPVGKPLQEDYWIEKALPTHLGKALINPSHNNNTAFKQWQQDTNTKLNFDLWLKHVYVAETEDDPTGVMKDRSVTTAYAISTSKGVKYCTEAERASYLLNIKNGVVTDASGDIYDTAEERTEFSGEGWAIFVLSPDLKLYANSHKTDAFHHSSFLAGEPIKCGGEIQVTEGRIVAVTPKTGHYKAGAPELEYFLQFCRLQGVNLKDMQVCPKPFEGKQWFAGNAVLLAKGEKPTAQQIAEAQAQPSVAPPMRPVPQPPGVKPGHVKGLIHQWENVGNKPRG